MSVNSFSSGTISETPGNIEVAMMTPAAMFLNRKSSRAMVYAANVPTTSVTIVVVPATTRLLPSERQNPTLGPNTASKFSSDHGLGSGELSPMSFGRRNAETTIQ
jgi:hypothetical protein